MKEKKAKDAVINTMLGYLMALEAYAPTDSGRTSAADLLDGIRATLESAYRPREQDAREQDACAREQEDTVS